LQINPSIAATPYSREDSYFDLPEEFSFIEREIRFRQKKYPHLTLDEVYERMFSLGSDGIQMSLDLSEAYDNTPTDYSNIFNHDGMIVDVTKVDTKEIIYLASAVEDIAKFDSLEHIKSLYMSTAPNVKLYYPEPFIASPSFVHNDIGYIHILQYQF
jgi:hypothetical protein